MSTCYNFEVRWLSRILRIFAVKELFDALSWAGSWIWMASTNRVGELPKAPPSRAAFWALLSLGTAILLLRYARPISAWVSFPARRISRSLNAGDTLWLSIGVRAFGVWMFLRGVGYSFQGFIAAASAAPVTAGNYGGDYYLMWAVIYLITGFVFAKRPDVIGLLITNAEPKAPKA